MSAHQKFCCFCLRSFSECMSQRNLKHPRTCNHQIKCYILLPTPAILPDPPDLNPAPLPAWALQCGQGVGHGSPPGGGAAPEAHGGAAAGEHGSAMSLWGCA